MTAPFDLKAVQARFHDLRRQRDVSMKAIEPTRSAYEALRAQQAEIDAKLAPLRADLKAANEKIAAIEQESADIVRILGGKTGAP